MDTLTRKDCVALIDDHPVVTDALKISLMLHGKFADLVSARTLNEAAPFIAVQQNRWIVVLDLHLKESAGSHTLQAFRYQYPDIPFVVFSGDDSTLMITEAYELGAKAFVSKNSPVSELVEALQKACMGQNYIPAHYENLICGTSLHPADLKLSLNLTGRQYAVLEHLLRGTPNKVIAARLGIAEGTVKAHLNGVYAALRVRNRVEAILRAQHLGLGQVSS